MLNSIYHRTVHKGKGKPVWRGNRAVDGGDKPQSKMPVPQASMRSGLRLSLPLQSQSLQAIGLTDCVRDRQSPCRTFRLGGAGGQRPEKNTLQ